MSSVLSGLLEHVSRDKSSVRSHVSSVSSCLLSVWPLLARWCEGGPSGKLAAVSLLKKMLAVDPKVRVHRLYSNSLWHTVIECKHDLIY